MPKQEPTEKLAPITLKPEGAYGLRFSWGSMCGRQVTPSVRVGWQDSQNGGFYGGVLLAEDVRKLHAWLLRAAMLLKE